jgi:hypothetical protein
MNYIDYILQSLYIFSVCFFIGVVVDNYFSDLSKTVSKTTKIFYAIIQLLVIITISYLLHEYQFKYIENYTPRVLFSSFLLSLQSNIITTFR